MRARALTLAGLNDARLRTLDVGAGTGFTTEGLVESIEPAYITMLDQSPHQLAVSERKENLASVRRVLGDAEVLPFEGESFDRYVSAGSIEYWPDPARAIVEAHRVLRLGGRAVVIGPLPPGNRIARWLAELWMLFPSQADYIHWFESAGFKEIEWTHVAPEWHSSAKSAYGIAIAGSKLNPTAENRNETGIGAGEVDRPANGIRFAARFAVGSLAGALFIPIAAVLALKTRLRGSRNDVD